MQVSSRFLALAMWWAKRPNRPLKGKFKCADATCFASGPNVESKMPSVCTTSGLLLLKTGMLSSFPGKTRICWGTVRVFSGLLLGCGGKSSSFSGAGTSGWRISCCWAGGAGLFELGGKLAKTVL